METIRKGYKHTDIGIIPEDWEVKTIGTVFTSFPTASFSREQLGDGNVNIFTMVTYTLNLVR